MADFADRIEELKNIQAEYAQLRQANDRLLIVLSSGTLIAGLGSSLLGNLQAARFWGFFMAAMGLAFVSLVAAVFHSFRLEQYRLRNFWLGDATLRRDAAGDPRIQDFWQVEVSREQKMQPSWKILRLSRRIAMLSWLASTVCLLLFVGWTTAPRV